MQEFKIKHMDLKQQIFITKELNEIMKIVQALEDSNILLKGVTKAN